MTLNFELNLDTLSPDLHAKVQVYMSVHSARVMRWMDRRTDTQTNDVKTITPTADAGCDKYIGTTIGTYSYFPQLHSFFSAGSFPHIMFIH